MCNIFEILYHQQNKSMKDGSDTVMQQEFILTNTKMASKSYYIKPALTVMCSKTASLKPSRLNFL